MFLGGFQLSRGLHAMFFRSEEQRQKVALHNSGVCLSYLTISSYDPKYAAKAGTSRVKVTPSPRVSPATPALSRMVRRVPDMLLSPPTCIWVFTSSMGDTTRVYTRGRRKVELVLVGS